MILTCPECATSYFVDDSRIPPDGRRVKCSSCGHRWRAGPDGPIVEPEPLAPEPLAPEPVAPAFEPPPEIDAAPEAESEAAPPDDIEASPTHRPATARQLRTPPVNRREGRSGVLVWAGAAALAAALIAGVIVFREQIVRVWPKSSAAYAGLGLAVDGGGLMLEQVRVQPAFLAGRPVLSVSGAIRNVRDVPVDAPPVRLTLLDRAGQPVAAKIARPEDARIPAKATRHFVVTLLDPPSTARDLEVRFEGAGDRAGPRQVQAVAAPPPPAAPQTAAAAPVAAPGAETSQEETPSSQPAPSRLSPAAASEHG